MFLARIDGTITATVKHATLGSTRLLIAQRLEADGSETSEPVIVADPLGVRLGALVLVTGDGDYARTLLGSKLAPLRLIVIGIVDAVDGGYLGRRIALRPPRASQAGQVTGGGFGRLGQISHG